jgi:diaminohydroxyphosphoribosylaminopyrimidine deaminase/5-amino-6-(5-phosphoribosylamino)uracil reductase
MDLFIAPANATQENRKISNAYSHKHSHKWRSEEQAILVGANTVKSDNPRLTVRDWTGRNPIRIVIDPENTIEANANVLNNDAPTIIFSGTKNLKTEGNEWIAIDFKKNTLDSILTELYKRNIQSVIVEGGRITLQHFIDQNLWDEARIFIADKFLNDGTLAPRINFSKKIHEENILDDRLYFLQNQ